MARTKDTYEVWKEQGILATRINQIKDLVSKNIPQNKIAERLGLSEKTLIKMKKNHPEICHAFIEGNDRLKETLINALYKRATGFDYTDETQTLEIVNGKKKQRIVKVTKYYPPDVDACKYLLIMKFGKDYLPKKYELELMAKRINLITDEWNPLEGGNKDE